jgi:hypothetical protein
MFAKAASFLYMPGAPQVHPQAGGFNRVQPAGGVGGVDGSGFHGGELYWLGLLAAIGA